MTKTIKRALFVSFAIGLLCTIAALAVSVVQSRSLTGAGTVRTEFLTLTFFTTSKTLLDGGGSTFTLRPGFGVAVLLIGIPLLACALAFRKHRDEQKNAVQPC